MGKFLTFGVPTRGIMSDEWAFSFRKIDCPVSIAFERVSNLPVHHARNQLVKRMIRNESEWIFMLDDDVCPPHSVINDLLFHKREIVSGLYWKRYGTIVPTAYQDGGQSIHPISSIPKNTLLEIDFVGAGCLLIHRNVFADIPAPWFEWKMDREDLPLHERVGEDFDFCRKARKAGYKIHLDTAVQCRHVGLGQAQGGQFGPFPERELL